MAKIIRFRRDGPPDDTGTLFEQAYFMALLKRIPPDNCDRLRRVVERTIALSRENPHELTDREMAG